MSEQAVTKREDGQVVQADVTSILQVIERAARDPGVDVEKMGKLMGLLERINARTAEREFNEAMNAAQEEMRPVSQDASNPQTRSKYASYAALDKALRPIYTKHGFSLSFDTGDAAEGYVKVICKVGHRAGHGEHPHLDMPADGKGAKGGDVMTKTHAVMSAVSYAKRGLLKMVFNIAEGDADDDGNAAVAGGKISEDQAATIRAMVADTGADIERFCKYMKADSIIDINARDFQRAIEALSKKAKK